VVRHLLQYKLGSKPTDDIDHLGNRRVRSVGELLEKQFRVGLTRMERAVKERMSISDITNLMPHDLINAKAGVGGGEGVLRLLPAQPVHGPDQPPRRADAQAAALRARPARAQPRAGGFEVRDVHPTHYGRICPIETPEGPNIGLISSLSTVRADQRVSASSRRPTARSSTAS